ncbi:MAG: DUF1727 domain-containing protein [Clostridia bacterium]|nr:DUF1727 domain-containing protein [Clostridia bacterium]
MGKKGSSTPGEIALKIAPNVLRDLAKQINGGIIAVCGTNGKTTTNNLLYDLLCAKGKRVVCNNVGANMLQGVACSFISKANAWGRLNCDYAAIECDEASLRHVVKHITPNKIVITNLFRDQLDRYGEIDITMKLLNEAIDKLPDATLILNADDPLCVQFGKGRKCVYYGIDQNCGNGGSETKEGRFCLTCGNELKYNYYHYSQLGNYECTHCDFKRPDCDYSAQNVNLTDGMSFDVHYKNQCVSLALNYRGFYNIYNVLASFCAFELLGLGIDSINDVYNKYKPQIGRMEPFDVDGKTVILNLSKNPAGFNQAISTLVSDPRTKDVIIVLNDNAQDGRDVSWIWDVDYERLQQANIKTMYASGIRKYDMALRLKYAGFDNIEIKDNTTETLSELAHKDGEICYVLINYTALFSTQDSLKQLSTQN